MIQSGYPTSSSSEEAWTQSASDVNHVIDLPGSLSGSDLLNNAGTDFTYFGSGGNISVTPGLLGDTLRFTGGYTSEGYEGESSINPTSMTIEALVKMHYFTTNYTVICRKMYTSYASPYGHALAIKGGTAPKLYISCVVNGVLDSMELDADERNYLSFDKNTHVAMTYDESDGTMAGYIDGKLVMSKVHSEGAVALSAPTDNWIIGNKSGISTNAQSSHDRSLIRVSDIARDQAYFNTVVRHIRGL